MKKILILSRSSYATGLGESMSSSLRIDKPIKSLLKKGQLIGYKVVNYQGAYNLLNNLFQWADIIITNRLNDEKILEKILENKVEKKLIYDIDDFIFEYPSSNKNSQILNEKIDVQKKFMEVSNKLIVSNEHLKKYIIERNKEYISKIKKIRIFVEDLYVADKKNIEKKILIINSDVIKLNEGKKDFIRAVNYMCNKYKSFSIDYIGDYSNELRLFKKLNYLGKMDNDTLMNFLRKKNYIFALVPLSINVPYNLYKSPIKYYTYGICKIPGIYSNNKIYSDIIVNNENGILVDNNYDSWINGMTSIIESNHLREKILSNAYYDVKLKYTYQNNVAEISEFLSLT